MKAQNEVGLDLILLDDFSDLCLIEHPKFQGNECQHTYGHVGEHEDAAGNTWRGFPPED